MGIGWALGQFHVRRQSRLMTTTHVPKTAAGNHGAWGVMALEAALLLSVLLLVVTGLDRPSEATPLPMPEPHAIEAVQSGTEPAAEPLPAPAPRPGPIR